MSTAMDASPTSSQPSQSPTSGMRSRRENALPAEPAPRLEPVAGQALELDTLDTSSGETSPIGLSLLYQKRVRQRESGLKPLQSTQLEVDLENQGETSPIGKALLDAKRQHARRRMQRERGELSDATGSCLNEPVEIGY